MIGKQGQEARKETTTMSTAEKFHSSTARFSLTPNHEAKHPWERAGFGKAPFQWLGCYEDIGPHKYPGGLEVGTPGQPMGCCDYCGNGIAECHKVRSADGREFIVGCDCVRKVNDEKSGVYQKAVRASMDRKNAKATKRRHDKSKRERAEIEAMLSDETFRAAASAIPHPQAWAAEKGETLLDSFTWMAKNAGMSGRARLLKAMRKLECAKALTGVES